MDLNATTRRLVWLAVIITTSLATCARSVQSARLDDLGTQVDSLGPRCGPDDVVGPERHDWLAGMCVVTADALGEFAGRLA